jgi:hypothetical protein
MSPPPPLHRPTPSAEATPTNLPTSSAEAIPTSPPPRWPTRSHLFNSPTTTPYPTESYYTYTPPPPLCAATDYGAQPSAATLRRPYYEGRYQPPAPGTTRTTAPVARSRTARTRRLLLGWDPHRLMTTGGRSVPHLEGGSNPGAVMAVGAVAWELWGDRKGPSQGGHT